MQIVKTKHSGEVAVIEGDTHISKWVQEASRLSHDRSTLSRVERFIPRGGCVVDVGAFIGDHTEFYAQAVGDGGLVLAMEPNPKAFECLRFNMKKYPQVVCTQMAASDKGGSISLAENENAGAAYAIEGEDHKLARIDDYELTRCDFIKMDCEGMEPSALLGAKTTILHYKPVLLLEVNAGALARQGFVPSTVYEILRLFGYTWRNVHASQPMHGPQFDILASHTSSKL